MEALYLYLLPLLIFIGIHILTNRNYNKNQNLPPGPSPALPFIGHLYLLKKPFQRSLSRLSDQYGPVIFLKLGRVPVVVVSSPAAAEECLIKNDIVFANRPKFMTGKYFGYNYTSLVWSSYGEHWRNLRRISSVEVLSSGRIQSLSNVRGDEVRSLIQSLLKISMQDPCQLADMRSACFDLTFNVMTRMISGKRYYGENVDNSKEAKAFQEITSEIAGLIPGTNVLDFLPFMRYFGLNNLERRVEDLHNRRDMFLQGLIDEHRSKIHSHDHPGDEKTLIGVLLALKEKEPEYYSDETIRSLMGVLIQAGSDTTASTMEWALAHLIESPKILKKAHVEIDGIVGQGRLVAESDLPRLPYLRCIITETMRLHPAAPLLVPHQASEDCTVGGFKIVGGTVLLVNVWHIHHSPKYWDDPEKFLPERFEGSAGIDVNGEFKILPFGSGRRGCPGNSLAIRVLGLALGSLIQCFNWEAEDGKVIDTSEVHGVPVYKAQPLLGKCSPRPNMLKLLSQL